MISILTRKVVPVLGLDGRRFKIASSLSGVEVRADDRMGSACLDTYPLNLFKSFSPW